MDTQNLPQAIELALEFTKANTNDIRISIIRQLGTHPMNHARFMQSLIHKGAPRDILLYYNAANALNDLVWKL